MTALDAVLFDFGGVFIASPFTMLGSAAAKVGVPSADLADIVFGSYDSDTDHPFHRLERGEISFDEARSGIAEIAATRGVPNFDMLNVFAEFAGISEIRPYMVDVVRAARTAGLKTGVVTNNIAEFSSTWRSWLPVDELFDDVVDSSAVGMRKPSTEIFGLACDRLGVAPQRTLFVDDHQGNVNGAHRAGLEAICCGYTDESASQCAREMMKLITSNHP